MKIRNFLTYSITIKLLVIYAIQSVCGGMVFYISLFLKSNTQLNALQIGTLISAISFGNIIGSCFSGYISDKYNPFYALKYGLIIQGSALITLIFVKDIMPLFLIMIFLGFGSCLYLIASSFILTSKYNVDTTNRTKIISLQSIVSNVGIFGAAILMGYSAEGYYFSIFFSIALIIILIGISLRPLDRKFYLSVHDNEKDTSNKGLNFHLYQLGLVGITLIGLIYSQLGVGYPIFLEENFGNINTGYLLSINPLIIIFFQALIIRFTSRFNELLILNIGLLFLGLSFLILNGPISVSIIIISCVVMTTGEILGFTYSQSIAFGYAPTQKRGRVLGLYRSICSMTKVVGAYFSGIIMNYLSFKWLWGFCFALSILGFVFILFGIAWSKRMNCEENLSSIP